MQIRARGILYCDNGLIVLKIVVNELPDIS